MLGRLYSDSHPKSMKSLSILQSLVAPETNLTASVWIASNCLIDSAEQLSHIVSLYLHSGRLFEKYIFSRDFLLILNLRALRIFILVQALSHMLFTGHQVHLLKKVIQKDQEHAKE